ncbi:hypothetical protein LWI28_011962 [Acer negundo]|uniref:glycine--tRNA ligase n=1 Tax=Acer negundo TaxID=4023 RepID=A0AAD5IZA4_ACENE|nr:hypothetical protein LWI28_011962 [Acer negundo]
MIKDVHQFVTRRLEQFLVDKGISPEVVRSVLAERANLPCLAAKTANKMEALSRGKLFPKVVEAYSRPTRIVRGKDVNPAVEVDESAFETVEERALWNAFKSVNNKIHPGIEVDDFVEISALLVQPLEDFFNNVFVMVEEERIRKNRLALLKKIADLPKGLFGKNQFNNRENTPHELLRATSSGNKLRRIRLDLYIHSSMEILLN